ncbi:kynureninase [Allosphingosinicella flava]|uniref:Kynureninase n=1 Tax=Allosphingosinicella flava TaxID=2771430 RepID=A0A7T2GI60_9SPHN|nr:kynureninase [Sphingosinicella flava]QPQ54329.1 kynureninase [Sphingosinicella flava]
MTITLDDARALDARDPLRAHRDRFLIDPDTIYLDGNSLGALPRASRARIAEAVDEQWGRDLIRSWNKHGWLAAPERIGAKIAPLIGARPAEVIVADSTSVNLFKLLGAALAARPGRKIILSEPGNFPTDLYIAQGVADALPGVELRTLAAGAIADAIDEEVAVVLLTHVHYKTGRMLDMAGITRAAHAKGALVLWDLSHSAGAVPVDLNGCDADLAVGCGYKYLNGGPGAPAFLFVAERLQAELNSPLSGWMGHAAPFAFGDDYAAAPGIRRFLCGTPPILAMTALEAGVEEFAGVDRDALFAKSRALTGLFIDLVEARCAGHGFDLVTPRDPALRGSHVSFRHGEAYPICQAMIARGVIGDFRAPDIFRCGFTPLYTGYGDVWRAVDILADIMDTRAWDKDTYRIVLPVT